MRVLLIVLMLIPALSWGQCQGNYEQLLQRGQVLVPCNDMVLMDAQTYGHYYWAAARLDSVNTYLAAYHLQVDSVLALHNQRMLQLDSVVSVKNAIISSQDTTLQKLKILGKEANSRAVNAEAGLKQKKQQVKILGISNGIILALLVIAII
jgi:hypothetical protein